MHRCVGVAQRGLTAKHEKKLAKGMLALQIGPIRRCIENT